MEKRIVSILILSIMCIVVYMNWNDKINIHLARLIYYTQYYLHVGLTISLIWILFSNKLIRILTVPIGLYYTFHFVVQLIEIFNPELKEAIFTVSIINYVLSLGMALSLIIVPIILKNPYKL